MATKIGIIGAGGMARYHIDGFRKAGAEVVAMADISVDAATISAKSNQIEHVFGNVAELLASDLDAVSIIVPNKFHGPLAIEALAAGKHVFCEKPPAVSADEVRAMIAARDRS